MRETQTTPKQPRDEQGNARGNDRVPAADPGQTETDDAHRIEGRDRPPAGRNRGPSPWLGGG